MRRGPSYSLRAPWTQRELLNYAKTLEAPTEQAASPAFLAQSGIDTSRGVGGDDLVIGCFVIYFVDVWVVAESVVLYLGLPLVLGVLTRYLVTRRAGVPSWVRRAARLLGEAPYRSVRISTPSPLSARRRAALASGSTASRSASKASS